MSRSWKLIVAIVLGWWLGGLVIAASAAQPSINIGFETMTVPDAAGVPVEIGVWYPTDAFATPHGLAGWSQVVADQGAPAASGRHALVVMSHGNGGWYAGHYDTAQALAHAGFVVAALTHPGDNYKDQSHATDMVARPRELVWLVDYMLGQWPMRASVDAERVGAFGFSSGGFTTLVAIGGTPDFSAFPAHCQAHPTYYDCGVVRQSGRSAEAVSATGPGAIWTHDVRIKAAVVAAPALGFTFSNGGLKNVTIPVQLWRAEDDHILPHPDYAEAARLALPSPPEYHLVVGADHFDFLAPCYAEQARRLPMICTSRPGFDRLAFHEAFNKAVVAFFERTLSKNR